jgi:hypothetical protein
MDNVEMIDFQREADDDLQENRGEEESQLAQQKPVYSVPTPIKQ